MLGIGRVQSDCEEGQLICKIPHVMAAQRSRPLPPPITVSMAFVRDMLAGLVRHGESPQAWLLEAGIAPALLLEPAARVTAGQYIALFRVLVSHGKDEGLGLFSRRLGPGSLALITHAALGASTIESALHRICRAFNLLQDDVAFALQREAGRTGLVIGIPASFHPERTFLHVMLARILQRVASWLPGERMGTLGVDFAIPAPAHAAEFSLLFPGAVRFDQLTTTLWFDKASLSRPMRRTEPDLREFLKDTPDFMVQPRRNPQSASARVRARLEQARPRWLDLPEVAQALNMSVSTLQRHLMQECLSFQAIKDQLRRDIAIAKLISHAVPIAELAHELGFSDSATFHRAFKTWTNSPPSTYRQPASPPA